MSDLSNSVKNWKILSKVEALFAVWRHLVVCCRLWARHDRPFPICDRFSFPSEFYRPFVRAPSRQIATRRPLCRQIYFLHFHTRWIKQKNSFITTLAQRRLFYAATNSSRIFTSLQTFIKFLHNFAWKSTVVHFCCHKIVGSVRPSMVIIPSMCTY